MAVTDAGCTSISRAISSCRMPCATRWSTMASRARADSFRWICLVLSFGWAIRQSLQLVAEPLDQQLRILLALDHHPDRRPADGGMVRGASGPRLSPQLGGERPP